VFPFQLSSPVAYAKDSKHFFYPSPSHLPFFYSNPPCSWYFGDIPRGEAEKWLLFSGNVNGTFLIRTGSQRNTLSLSIRDGEGIKHYRIRKLDEGGYFIASRVTFRTLLVRDKGQGADRERRGGGGWLDLPRVFFFLSLGQSTGCLFLSQACLRVILFPWQVLHGSWLVIMVGASDVPVAE